MNTTDTPPTELTQIPEQQVVESTPQATKDVFETFGAVNLDEILIEKLNIKIRHYKEVDALDDEGNPILDENGVPFKNREPVVRTARIQNFVPLPLFAQVQRMQARIKEEQAGGFIPVDSITDAVLSVWQLSEKWMTKERLAEGLDPDVLLALFTRFFNPSRFNRLRV